MVPAEVDTFIAGEGSKSDKVHTGKLECFETPEIKADVECRYACRTRVNFSGIDLYYVVRKDYRSPIRSEGQFKEGQVEINLTEEGESISIRSSQGSNMQIRHTFHDGSTREEG